MLFVWVGWMFFRSRSIEQIAGFIRSSGNFALPPWWLTYLQSLLVLASPVIALNGWQAHRRQTESFLLFPRPVRNLLQGLFLMAIAAWWKREESAFIYFQF